MNAIVVGEIGLALILLISVGLLLRAFHKVQAVDPGFRTSGILTYRISLPSPQYEKRHRRQAFFAQHLERIRALPGVESASLIQNAPLSGHTGYFFQAEGAAERRPDEDGPVVLTRIVMPGYFETMGVKLCAGRFFTEQDMTQDSEPTVIVNQTFAQYFWPNESPVGKRIANDDSDNWMRVIGVTQDVKHYGFDRDMRPGVYLPYVERACESDMMAIVRTSGDPFSLVSSVREIVRSTDPGLPICDVQTMAQRIQSHEFMWVRRTYTWLFGIFGGIAAIMAVSGIYGVIAYSVGQRTQEIGVRMALGARSGDVLKAVLGQGLKLTLIGVVIGLAGALALTRVISSLLYDVSPTDPLTFVCVSLVLAGVALLASYIPARRAARIDPM
ncbi:MAG: ABC transporter permease, partial [Phycisphaerales bacterium]